MIDVYSVGLSEGLLRWNKFGFKYFCQKDHLAKNLEVNIIHFRLKVRLFHDLGRFSYAQNFSRI